MHATLYRNANSASARERLSADRNANRYSIAIIVAFVAITLWLGSALGVWTDELYTLHSTSRGPLKALESALVFEQQPPFYFVILSFWRMVSNSDFFARCFSIGCAAFTLIVLHRFIRRHVVALGPSVFVCLVALNPFFIWTALEIRTYALLIAEAAVIATSFYNGFLHDRIDRPARAVFVIVSILGVYTQYYFGFLVVGCACAVLVVRRERLKSIVLALVPFAIASLPAAKIALWQAHQIDHTSVHELSNVKALLATIETFILPRDWIDRGYQVGSLPRIAYTTFVVGSVAFLIPVLWRGRWSRLALGFGVISIVVGLLFFLLILMRVEMYFPRHITVLFIPLVLAVSTCIAGRMDRAYVRNVVAGYVLLSLVSAVFAYRPLAKNGDWKRVGDYLTVETHRGDVIDIFDAEMVLGVRHYYRGGALLRPIPVEPVFDRWDIGPYKLLSPAAAGRAIERAYPSGGRRWLVISPYPCPQYETVEGCRNLLQYVSSNYDIALERRFYLTDVLLLRPKMNGKR